MFPGYKMIKLCDQTETNSCLVTNNRFFIPFLKMCCIAQVQHQCQRGYASLSSGSVQIFAFKVHHVTEYSWGATTQPSLICLFMCSQRNTSSLISLIWVTIRTWLVLASVTPAIITVTVNNRYNKILFIGFNHDVHWRIGAQDRCLLVSLCVPYVL